MAGREISNLVLRELVRPLDGWRWRKSGSVLTILQTLAMSNKRRSDARKAPHVRGRAYRPLWRWQHEMVLPVDPNGVSELRRFVAAHMEDPVRCGRCPLAVKVWRFLDGGSSEEEEEQGLPAVLPDRCVKWKSAVVWMERYRWQ